MEPQQALIFDDAIAQVMKTLPPVIRTYLTQERYTPVARSLMAKYKLRIDQGGVLEREILFLLMGVVSPVEFTVALEKEAGLSREIINGISQDVNDQIFIPLRKEEEKSGLGLIVAPVPAPSAPQPTTHFKLENKIPLPHSAPLTQKNEKSKLPPEPIKGALPPKVFLPRTATLGEVVRSILAVPKPLDSANLLEDHEEPHIEINKISAQLVSGRTISPPQNLPGTIPPTGASRLPIVPAPEIQKVEVYSEPITQKPEVPTPPVVSAPREQKPVFQTPITNYSNDPYREPIDEPPVA